MNTPNSAQCSLCITQATSGATAQCIGPVAMACGADPACRLYAACEQMCTQDR
jgi:hypothetical protein